MMFLPQTSALLEHLSAALEGSGDDLTAIFTVLIDDLTEAVPSFAGLAVTVVAAGEPVTVAAIDVPAAARASMLLPLHLISDLPAPSSLLFYAAQPGAFADLAAEARTTYSLDGQVKVDGHLPAPDPHSTTDAAAAAEGRSTVNQAIGVLIDRGHLPEYARQAIAARAAAAGVPELQVAADILDGLAGAGGSSHTTP